MNGACNGNCFGPPPGKGQQVIFQRFVYQILCVFSQMKETKRIRQDFYSVAWVMP